MSNSIPQNIKYTVETVIDDTLSLPAEIYSSFEVYYFFITGKGEKKGLVDVYASGDGKSGEGMRAGGLSGRIRRGKYTLNGERYWDVAHEPEIESLIRDRIGYKKSSTVINRVQREKNGIGIAVFHAFSRDQIINQIFKNGFLQELIYVSMREDEVNRRMGRKEINSSMIANSALRAYIKERNLISSDRLSQISATTYEAEECEGKIAFTDNEGDLVLNLKERGTIYTHSLKLLRKYLVMTQGEEGLSLLMDNTSSHTVLGLGTVEPEEDAYTIEVKGAFNWVIHKGGKEELEFKQGRYIIPSNYGTDTQLTKKLREIFDKDVDVPRLVSIIQEVKGQEHGTMLIISKDAKDEAKRLCESKRGIAIAPVQLRADSKAGRNLVHSITSIDGALIVDEKGVCYAIGVILDGKVNYMSARYSDRGRGSRFNSAISYIYDSKYLTVAVIVSDDKYFNIVSNRDFNFEESNGAGQPGT